MKRPKSPAEQNQLCQRCANSCKQLAGVKLIRCPHFEAEPQQLEIPLFKKSRNKKDKVS